MPKILCALFLTMCLFSGAFIICFLPYFTLFMVVAYCGNDQCVNPTVFTITIWFGYFNSTLNPILYPLCNANFKTAFKRMLRMDSVKENKNELNKNGAQGEFPLNQHLFWTHKLFIKKTHRMCREQMWNELPQNTGNQSWWSQCNNPIDWCKYHEGAKAKYHCWQI